MAARPNVIVILSDDLGYADVGFNGCQDIPTPNIDSLARNGIRFTQGYVSSAICSPTRSGLLTGRYQQRWGGDWNVIAGTGIPLTETTFAQRMKGLGYATAAVGKWHVGFEPERRPIERGFDEFYGTLGNSSFFNPKIYDSLNFPKGKTLKGSDVYTTDLYAAQAADFIRRHKDRPFFLYLPFNAVHESLEALPKYLARFPNITDEKRKTYAAMLSALDDAVGVLLETLGELELLENTMVFFLNDNGIETNKNYGSNQPLGGGKGTLAEGGIRVPFVLQWKSRFNGDTTYEHPVIALDILPTAVSAAGGEIKPEWKLDGVDLLPFLKGQRQGPPHESLFWRMQPMHWAIRRGHWKLIKGETTKPQLYNLAEDSGEKTDLARRHPRTVRDLRTAWNEWNAQMIPAQWEPKAQPDVRE